MAWNANNDVGWEVDLHVTCRCDTGGERVRGDGRSLSRRVAGPETVAPLIAVTWRDEDLHIVSDDLVAISRLRTSLLTFTSHALHNVTSSSYPHHRRVWRNRSIMRCLLVEHLPRSGRRPTTRPRPLGSKAGRARDDGKRVQRRDNDRNRCRGREQGRGRREHVQDGQGEIWALGRAVQRECLFWAAGLPIPSRW